MRAYLQPDEGETLDQGRPKVAAAPGKVLVVVGVVILVVGFLVYSILFSSKKEAPKAKTEEKRPVAEAQLEPPPLPQAPALLVPPPPLAPPTIPEPATVQNLKPEDNGAAQKEALARMQSPMVVLNGGGGGGASTATGSSADGARPNTNSDPNSAFANNVAAANSQAEHVKATQIGDLRHTIAQGRLIQGTMESALNTDLPSPIRAIVSRDTYAEAGTEPLIPKGSRIIGTYNTDISGGQSRVFIVWTRIIRPDGVDIMINGPSVDSIGQAGIGGQVDTRFQAIFSRAIMSSIVSIAFAIGSDQISGGSTTTSNSAVGGSTTTGDAATTATTDAVGKLGTVVDSFVQRFVDARPTILVDQGTPINIFVNRDLIFPAQFSPGGTRVIY